MAEELAPGFVEEQEYRKKGVPEEAIIEERSRNAADYMKAGFSEQQVKDYYGIKDPDMAPMKAYVQNNLAAAKEANKPAEGANPDQPMDVNPIEQFYEDVKNGFVGPEGLQRSTLGLALRGKMPDQLPPEHAHRAYQIAGMIGQTVGDIPAMIEGGVVGAMAGTAVAGPAGGVVGGMAGPFAFPAALRKTLMDYYEKGTIRDGEDFMNRLASTTWEAVKQGGVGVATMGTAKVVGPYANRLLGEAVGPWATKGAEVTALTYASGAAEGQLPHADDFLNAGIVLGGLHGAGLASSKLRGAFGDTGVRPENLVEEANKNLPLKQDVLLTPDKPKVFKPADWVDEFRQLIVDQTDPILKAQTFLGVDKNTPIDQNPHEVFQYAKTWSNNLNRFMSEGTLDFKTGEKNGEGYSQIMKDVPKKVEADVTESDNKVLESVNPEDLKGKSSTWNKLVSYLVARSAVERQGQISERTGEVKKTGVDIEAAEKVVEAGKAEYEPIVKRRTEFKNKVMDYLVDSGAISKESAQAMKDAYEAHIPFNRLIEPDPLSGKIKGSGKPYREFLGSEKKILDPLVSEALNISAIIKEAERNRAVKTFADLIQNSPEGKQVGEVLKPKLRPIEVKNQEVRSFLESHGYDASEIPSEAFNIFRRVYKNTASNEVTYGDKGVERTIRLREDVAEAVKSLNMDPQSTKIFVRVTDNILKTSASMMRVGVTGVPEFILNNTIRDQFDAGVQTQYKSIPIFDSMKALGDIWKKNDVWYRAMSAGSLTDGWQHVKKFMDTDMWKLDQDTGLVKKAWNVVKSPEDFYQIMKSLHINDITSDLKKPFQAYQAISQAVEVAPRLAEAKNTGGLEDGTTLAQKMEAGRAYREVTVNFDQVGKWVKTVAPYIPFMKVGISGTDKLFKNIREDGQGTALKAMALITIPSLWAWWYNKDDSRYKNAPEWLKATSIIMCTNKWETALNDQDAANRDEDLRRQLPDGTWEVNNGTVYHIPRPFGLGMIFGALPETMMNSLYHQDPKSFEELGEAFVGGIIPNMLPPPVLAVGEHYFNLNKFTDRQIVPNHLQQMFSDHQYNEYTSETAKQMGKFISHVPFLRDVGRKNTKLDSPLILDNYIREMLGSGGMYATKILDASLHAAGIGNLAPKPVAQLGDLPVIRAFVLRYPSAKAQVIEDFYQRYETATTAINSYRDSMKKGHEQEAEAIIAQYGPQMGKFTQVAKALSLGNKIIQGIYADPETRPDGSKGWTPIEKRQMIDQEYYKMIQAATAGHQAMDQFMDDFNKDKKTSKKSYGLMRENAQ